MDATLARLFFVVVLLALIGCGGSDVPADTFVAERDPEAVLLDVRTPAEYAGGHLAGALNINYLAPDFRARVDSLDRDRAVYLYCGSGARSGRAASILEEMGFREAVNIGGYGELRAAGAPVVE